MSRQAKLASIARTAAGSPVGRRFGARIDMCLADVTGEWPALLMRSHRTSDPQVLAWMHARFARWSALDGDGATAQHHYLLAIERASAGNMYQEASDWLYAWRTVRSWYDNFDRDEQHALAQALRVHAHAGVHRLPGTEHTVEQALRALYADKPNEALERVRRWMWQAVVRADLTYEVEAVTALGDLVSTKALFTEAAEYYIRAGATDKARTAAEHITEPVDWSVAGLLRPLTASRRAAFAAIAGGADLLVDEAVAPWVEAALDEITELTPAPRRHAENAGKEAFEALAALADTLTCQQVAQLLVRVDALLDRPKARHSESDDTIIAILTTVARRHRCVQEHAVRSMLHALQINDRMADRVLGAEDVLRSNPEIVHSALAEAAHDGHHYACLALILAQADVEPARPYAKTYVEAELDPTRARRNIVSLSTKPRDAAVLAGILPADRQAEFVRTMLARVLDTDAAAAARRSDLLAIKTIAPHLDRNTRAQLFPSALEIAQGRHDREEPNPWPQHPFSRAEIVLPPSGLGVDGLRCAAALVDEPEQANLVELAAMELLGPKHPDRGWAIATVLNGLPGDLAHLQLTDLANRPQPALRALAAHRWVRNPDALSTSRAEVLAADTDHNVRRELAVAAAAVPVETRPESVERVRRILVLDRRRAIRQAADSALTATACEVTQSDK
ncbi:hypothetical protein ABZS66_56840 [Dactylosporangium sp. NPDC005572]|uniref:hypothetical protein n=1 Tax=Dactylosporangium sp. NPDC005572 TaxID=3156889 RepID=UPI0033AD7FED